MGDHVEGKEETCRASEFLCTEGCAYYPEGVTWNSETACINNHCIPSSWVNDGFNDCVDLEDERQ